MMKWQLKTFIVLLVSFLVIELAGRLYGLCDYPLYVESPYYEYIHAPNQKLVIYGNNFSTNEWSMRSESFNKDRDTNVIIIIGDSVINGGNRTDQSRLATSLLEGYLESKFEMPFKVLNISAGSWGPDNMAAYLQHHGTFNADAMILVCSSHDATDHMVFDDLVGEHPQFPDKQPTLAWEKVINRSWHFVLNAYSEKSDSSNNPLENEVFNTGFADLYNIATEARIPFIVYLHVTSVELQNKKISSLGDSIIQFCISKQLPLYREIDLPIQLDHFKDYIHYNDKGQRFLSEQLLSILLPYLKISSEG